MTNYFLYKLAIKTKFKIKLADLNFWHPRLEWVKGYTLYRGTKVPFGHLWVKHMLKLASLNPFLPTGQFLAPKLIIVKCLIDILYFKVLF